MQKSDLIERLNLLHLERAVAFNQASPADQVRLAKDPSFWRIPHRCNDFAWDGVCLECSRRVRSSTVPYRRSVFPREAVVSP